mmetsp:Transcript_10694/g.16206  ORF Transcript_10694/g.16206 Transcript_10694/m.16206 type:complete len:522 (-) Transcript_10694:180-1745(-)
MYTIIFILMTHLSLYIYTYGSIYQSSEAGQVATIAFDMTVSGGQSECTSLLATGNLTSIYTSLYLDTSFYDFFSDASDMFIAVKQLDQTGDVIQCLMYGGYDYDYEGCGKAGHWPESWDSSSDGTYTATADVARAQFSGQYWSVCVGNGWEESLFSVSYDGTLDFSQSLITYGLHPSSLPSGIPSKVPTITSSPTFIPSYSPTFSPSISHFPSASPSLSPTSTPSISNAPTSTPIYVSSECNTMVTISFDTFLSGAETICVNFGANESLESVNASLFYGGSDDEVAADFVFLLYHTTDTYGIQIGGHEYYIPTVEYVGSWPTSWKSSAPGSYTANINVSTYGIGGGNGTYSACVANGWYYGDIEHYTGYLWLEGLVMKCDVPPVTLAPISFPTPKPTQTPTSTVNVHGGSSNDDDNSEAILIGTLVPVLIITGIVVAWCCWTQRTMLTGMLHTNQKGATKTSDSTNTTELGEVLASELTPPNASKSYDSGSYVPPNSSVKDEEAVINPIVANTSPPTTVSD